MASQADPPPALEDSDAAATRTNTSRSPEFWRGLPFGATVAFILAVIGTILMSVARRAVLQALDGAGTGATHLRNCVLLIHLPVALSLLADIVTLVLACLFSAMVRTREAARVDGSAPPDEGRQPAWRRTHDRLAKPSVVAVLEVFVKLTFVMQLILSWVFLVMFVAMDVAGSVCDSGDVVKQQAQNLAASLLRAGNAPALTEGLIFDRYCVAAKGLDGGALVFFLGSAFMVLGQGGMMACTSEFMDRVVGQPNRQVNYSTDPPSPAGLSAIHTKDDTIHETSEVPQPRPGMDAMSDRSAPDTRLSPLRAPTVEEAASCAPSSTSDPDSHQPGTKKIYVIRCAT